MKKFLTSLMLISSLSLGILGVSSIGYAEDTAPAVEATTAAPVATEAATPAPAEAATAETPAPAAAAPTPNKGDTSWMIVATLLVILMSIPGLALFYGGLVRLEKHAVNTHADFHHILVNHGAVVCLWLLGCIHAGQ